jgi:hypothetical protein
MITGVTAPATSPDIVAGIFVVGAAGSDTRLYYNSISMTGDRGAVATQMPSFGIAITGTDPTVELKDNIFYSTQIASGGGVNAKSYAIGMVSTLFVNLNSNYNDFFTSGANAGHFRSGSLGAGVGTDYATVALWGAAVSDDANSLQVDPLFVDPTNNLHITTTNSSFDGLGTPVTGITDDYDCNTRNATTPDIGADEFTPSVLPVTLLNFSGYKDGSRNQLRWTTASESNNSGFEVQRSTDGVNYTALGFVNTQALGGNSTSQLDYAFTDNNVIGSRQYYRLRQVNFDGNSKLSNIVLIKGDKPVSLTIDGLFPNPASSLVNVLIATPNKDKITLVVTDIAGRTAIQQVVNVETGSNTIPVDINRLTSGTYLVKLVCSSSCESAVGKFVKQ